MSTPCVKEIIYEGQSLFSIRLDTKRDLTDVVVAKILYVKPNGDKGSWEATVDGQIVVYNVQVGDINQAGRWDLYSYVEEAGGRYGIGTIVTEYVECSPKA